MGYIKQLKNENGDCVYPLTKAEAVYIQKTDGTTVKQQKLDDKLAEMESSFQAGCDTLVNKLKELGITPSSSSPTDIAAAIQTACSTYYNKGVAAADARVNKASASYSQGVTDADNRVNTNSASYSAGYAQGKADADTTSAYNNGYNAGIEAVKANPGNYNLTTHGSSTQYFQAAYDGGNVNLRRTTGGIDVNMGHFYISEENWSGSNSCTGGYTFTW